MSQLLKIVSTPDLVEQVYAKLLGAISEGELAPGARITQDEIAEKLSVSRQPVLQALRLLKKDGFIIDAPGRGVLVAPLDAVWLTHVYPIRIALDVLAAHLACASSYAFDSNLIAQGRKAARGKSIGAMIEADIEFHCAIYRASNNPLIEQSAQLHWKHIRRAMGTLLQTTEVRLAVWDEHEAISRAIAAKDARKSEALTRTHGERAFQMLESSLVQVLQAANSAS